MVDNDNQGLVEASISSGVLTLSNVADAYGEANITIRATDTGSLFVEDTFNVLLDPVNDPPTVPTPISDVTVNENASDTIIDLTSHFDDVEDGSATLGYSWVANSNPGLVTASITGNSLTLSYATDATGEANITIQAEDLGSETVDDQFLVTVNPTVAPTIDITIPSTDGTIVSGKITITADVTGASPSIVEFTLWDETESSEVYDLADDDDGAPYDTSLHTKNIPEGTYVIIAQIDLGADGIYEDKRTIVKAPKGDDGGGSGGGGGSWDCENKFHPKKCPPPES